MENLVFFALTITSILAFSNVLAYKTTINSTNSAVEDIKNVTLINSPDTPRGAKERCRNKIPIKQLNHCEMHLKDGIIANNKPKMVPNQSPAHQQHQHLQQCCTQLKKVSNDCQCDAIQQVYDEARQQGGVVEMRQMLSKAQRLPKECNLDVPECPLVSPRV